MTLALSVLGLVASGGWLLWLRRRDETPDPVSPRHRADGSPRILDGRRTG